MENMRLAREIEERQRYNALQMKKSSYDALRMKKSSQQTVTSQTESNSASQNAAQKAKKSEQL